MPTVAFIGLGHIGGGMAVNLVKGGHTVRAFDLSAEALDRAASHGCTAVALTPGWLRSEMMLGHYGVTEENWRDCVQKTIQMSPDSVTIYQMEIPFNTAIYKQMKAEGRLVAPVVR